MNYFEKILKSQQNLIVFALDIEYKYQAFNKNHFQAMKKIWGVEIKEGESMLDYILLESDRKKAKRNFGRALKGESFELIEVYGSTTLNRLYYENAYSPIFDGNNQKVIGVSVIVRDISPQKNTENLLRRNQNLLASINQNLQVGIYRSTVNDGLIYINRAMIEMFGYDSVSEMLSKESRVLYNEEFDREKMSGILLEEGELSGFEVLFKRKDGTTFWGSLSAIATTSEDGTIIFDGAIKDITDKKQDEQQIQQLSELFKVATDLFSVSNFEGYFEDLNPQWEKLLGYSIDELKLRPFIELLHPDDYQKTIEEAEAMYNGKPETIKFENRYRKKNGEYIWLEWNSVMNYELKKSYSVARDITSFKSKKNLQDKFTKSLLTLSKRSTLQNENFLDFIKFLIKKAAETLQVGQFSYWRFNQSKSAIECIYLYKLANNSYHEDLVLSVKDYPTYINALKQERTLAANKVRQDPRTIEFVNDYFLQHDIYSLLDAQITINDFQLGIICAEQLHKEREWSYEEQNYVASLSEIIATAHSVYERRLTQTALKASEQRFKILFENLPIGAQLLDHKGTVIECNDLASELLDISESGLVGKSVHSTDWDIIYDDYTPLLGDDLPVTVAIRTKKSVREVQMGVFRPRLKSYIWLEVDAIPLLNEAGEVEQVICTFVDITKRREAIVSLKESERRFRNLFQKGQLAQLLINPQSGEIVDANEAAEHFYGYSYEELTSLKIQEINQLSEEEVFAGMQNAKSNQKNVFRFKHQLANGTIRNVEVYSTVLEYADAKFIFSVILDVTERENALASLIESEEMLSNIADNIPGLMMRYAEHNKGNIEIEFISKGVEDLLEITQEEALANTNNILEKIHHKDLKALQQVIAKSKKTEEPWILNYRLMMGNGEVKWMNGRGVPKKLSDGSILWYLLALDITQQVTTEAEVKRLAFVAQRASDILITCNEHGKITWANSANYRLAGLHKEELIGQSLVQGLIGEGTDLEEVAKLNSALANQKSYQGILKVYKYTGEACWLQYESTPIYNEANTFLYSIVVKRDVTELLDKQKNLEHLLNTTLDQNNRLKEFSYITSHNIRSSVANLLGLTNIILDEPDNKMYVEMLRTSTKKLDVTINNLNELLYFENQFNPENKKQCNLYASLQRFLELNELLINEKNVEIKYDISKELFVNAIPAYLDSIFHNLITNAIKYGLTRHSKRIEIATTTENDKVVIKVSDFGMGIDLALHGDKLFKLGSRLHSNTDGQGLGLFMTKKQVDALGGSIEVSSEVSKGTTFTVRLPQ